MRSPPATRFIGQSPALATPYGPSHLTSPLEFILRLHRAPQTVRRVHEYDGIAAFRERLARHHQEKSRAALRRQWKNVRHFTEE